MGDAPPLKLVPEQPPLLKRLRVPVARGRSRSRRVIAVARAHGALGWKVNGAGGDGGSLTVLCGPGADARHMLARAIGEIEGASVIPIRLSAQGLRRREGRRRP